ncbi:hypothetical protein DH2020_017733 [Rehmannia glutinosa]|uniref:Vesicle-associated membrane protein n=1 Tax=Rehmannia glutinosa TaxID=99300 RepID=A0ABR0WRR3_REHGL
MAQNSRKTLIYALVARGTPPVVLAEYTEFSGNFNSIAYQCLQKLPSSNNKFTYNCDNHTFNYLVHDGFRRQVPMAFLDRIRDDFVAKYGGGKAATTPANGLNKEFGPKLKEHMQYCIEHPEEISKLAKVKAQVSEVKGVMMENIEKVLDRGEKIELLVDKTENLHHQIYADPVVITLERIKKFILYVLKKQYLYNIARGTPFFEQDSVIEQ